MRIFFFILFALSLAPARGQGYLYFAPFSFSSGSNAPGNELSLGHVYKAETFILSATMKINSQNNAELKRSNTASMLLGIGFPINDFSISAVIGPEYFESNFGVTWGGQFMHLLKINNKLNSIISSEITTSKFYNHQFTVSMGLAWKLSE